MNTYSRVYAAVDLDAILHNIEAMKGNINPDTQIMAVIKTDGYGHGAVPVGQVLEPLPCVWGYAVATAEEGLILRRNGLKKPILVLGATFPEQYHALAEADIRPTVYSLKQALEMSNSLTGTNLDFKIHVKIDTGLSRLGFQVTEEAAEEIARISGLAHMILEGVFTHYAKSDAADKTMAKEQLSAFHVMEGLLRKRKVSWALCHSCNSGGIIDLREANMDLVRAGISLYGMWPSDEVQKERVDLKPALSLKSRIVFLKDLEPGRTISYGATYTVKEPMKVATVPVGYGDGYPRSLSNRGYVLIRGRKAPICGRICMDQFMVDVTDIPVVSEGDEVVLIGTSGDETITMEELGELSGRFNYEFACDLGKRIPRVYYRYGVIVDSRDYFGE